jgi:hypothetical protein
MKIDMHVHTVSRSEPHKSPFAPGISTSCHQVSPVCPGIEIFAVKLLLDVKVMDDFILVSNAACVIRQLRKFL